MSVLCFFDFEFNQRQGKNEIISVGMVMVNKNTFEEIVRYYNICKPIIATEIDSYVKKVTGLTQEDLDNGLDFTKVSKDLMDIIHWYDVQNIFIYGGCDLGAVRYTCSLYEDDSVKEFNQFFSQAINLQNKICSSIKYNGKIINKCWKLSKLNNFYKNDKLDAHNALNDAIMLANIYQKYVYFKEIDISSCDNNLNILEAEEYISINNRDEQQRILRISTFFEANKRGISHSTESIVDAWNRFWRDKKRNDLHLVFNDETKNNVMFQFEVGEGSNIVHLRFNNDLTNEIYCFELDYLSESNKKLSRVCKKILKGQGA